MAAEEDFAAGFAKALGYVQRQVVQRVRATATTLVAAGAGQQDDNDSAWGALPLVSVSASIDPAAVYDAAWWRKGYTRYVAKRSDRFYGSTVASAGAELGVEFDPDDPTIEDGLDGLDDTAEAWGAGLDAFVQGQVRDGIAAGDTVSGLASRLRDSEDSWFGAARAALLASVAVAATYNRASLAAGTSARAQGTSSTKEWVSAGDDKVRDSHVEMDGQTVDIGDDFLVSGVWPAAGPHDERLPPDEVCNCRCTLAISGDGGNVEDDSTTVGDDGIGLDYATDGSEDDALVASPAQLGQAEGDALVADMLRVAELHTHGHCERCGGWLEGRAYCSKCGRGYSGPLLNDGADDAPTPVEVDMAAALPALLGRFEWDEDKHPRADNGRWGEGGAGGNDSDAGARTPLDLPILGGTAHGEPVDTGGEPEEGSAEERATFFYQSDGYAAINGGLRTGAAPDHHATALTREIARHTVGEDRTVYRAVDPSKFELGEGMTFTDHGFVSTDVDGYAAVDIAENTDNSTLLAIRVPAGSQGMFHPSELDEPELILQRGSTFEVVGRDSGSGARDVWEVNLVSQRDRDANPAAAASRPVAFTIRPANSLASRVGDWSTGAVETHDKAAQS